MSRIVIEDLPSIESPSDEPGAVVLDAGQLNSGRQPAAANADSPQIHAAERPTNGQAFKGKTLARSSAAAKVNHAAEPGQHSAANGSAPASDTSRNPALNDVAIAELFGNATGDDGQPAVRSNKPQAATPATTRKGSLHVGLQQ